MSGKGLICGLDWALEPSTTSSLSHDLHWVLGIWCHPLLPPCTGIWGLVTLPLVSYLPELGPGSPALPAPKRPGIIPHVSGFGPRGLVLFPPGTHTEVGPWGPVLPLPSSLCWD